MEDKTITCKDCGKDFCLLKMSKLFIKKKGSTMNHKDVLIAEEQESNKITEATETSNLLLISNSTGLFL